MRNKYIYLDNAATTFPKPASVIKETLDFINRAAANPGRSGHRLSLAASERIYYVRERVSELLGLSVPERVVFTPGATFALNLAIKTEVKDGSHVLISDMEHNSVLRTVHALSASGRISYSVFDSDDIAGSVGRLITERTTHIISTLASNVNGAVLDLTELSEAADRYHLGLIFDASQRLGHAPLSLSGVRFDALCCAGHKALFGFAGAGFCVFGHDGAEESFIEGGSGSESKELFMPKRLPEHFEAGTLPVPAIISLGAGIDYISSVGLESIEAKLGRLTSRAKEMISDISGIRMCQGYGGTVMLTHDSIPSEILAKRLDAEGVAVRGGFHCAPLAHKKLGTYADGAVRVSFSYLNTEKETERFGAALKRAIMIR